MMKKTHLLTGFLFAASMFLCSCHGTNGQKSFSVPESFDEAKTYEISFWAKNDTNKAQTDIYRKAIEDFEKIYPNITVSLKLYTDYSRIYNDVITNIATNTTPNVCITYPDHIATYLEGSNTVVSLDELFVDENYGLGGKMVKFESPKVDEIVPEFLEECKFNNHYYALPYMRSTEALYINKTYVEALGYEVPDIVTWDYIWEVSEAATAKDSDDNYIINGQKVMIPFIYKSTDNMMIQMLHQKNEPLSDSEGNIFLFNDTTKEILNEVAKHVKSGAFSTFKISSYPANFLNAGQCIFAVDSTAGATWMGCDAPLLDIPEDSIVRFETVVRPIPQFDTDNISMISQGPSVCVFNKEDSGEVLASWLFTQFLLTNDVQIAYSETEGYVPVTTLAYETDEYNDYLAGEGEDNDTHYNIKLQAAKLLLANEDKTFVTSVFNGSASLREASGSLIEEVAKSIRRKKTVDDEFIDNLFADTTSLYRLDQINESGNVNSPLPAGSKALIITLISIWILILVFLLICKVRNKKHL